MMDIHGDQIATQFATYGVPGEVADFFDASGIDPAKLTIDKLPPHGVRAVKELMAYTTGTQVVLAIAALALGEMDAADHGAGVQRIPNGKETVELVDPDEPTDETPISRNGIELADGLRVRVCDRSEDGKSGIEGAGLKGEIDRIEARGGNNIVFLYVDPEPGHTDGTLIQVKAQNIEVLTDEA